MSVFGYENKASGAQAVTIWLDGEVPSDSNRKTGIGFTFYKGNFPSPVYVDLRQGKVYDIPKTMWFQNEAVYKLNDIPCYDWPILIADKNNTILQESSK